MRNIPNNRLVIADSGYWVALGNPKDRHHQRALHLFKTLDAMPITTWPVITEVCYLLHTRVSHRAQLVFMQSLTNGASRLFHLDSTHFDQMEHLMYRYRNLPMDLADASLVILAETLGHGRILSTDQRDFESYRWKSREPFDNLLLPD